MSSNTKLPTSRWFVVADHLVTNLGQAELAQSGLNNLEFRAVLVLNSYESNCLRDWLSLRWKAGSLEGSRIATAAQSRLGISRLFNAESLQAARSVFHEWLASIALEREQALQSRK